MHTTGIPLAGGLGLSGTDVTSVAPLAILGIFLAWHGCLVFKGTVPVPQQRLLAFLQRPDADLSGMWLGIGLLAWGFGLVLSIPPFLPLDIFGQVIAWAGALAFLVGIVSYIYMPNWMRPAWLREQRAAAAHAAAAADQPAAAAEPIEPVMVPDEPVATESAPETGGPSDTDQAAK